MSSNNNNNNNNNNINNNNDINRIPTQPQTGASNRGSMSPSPTISQQTMPKSKSTSPAPASGSAHQSSASGSNSRPQNSSQTPMAPVKHVSQLQPVHIRALNQEYKTQIQMAIAAPNDSAEQKEHYHRAKRIQTLLQQYHESKNQQNAQSTPKPTASAAPTTNTIKTEPTSNTASPVSTPTSRQITPQAATRIQGNTANTSSSKPSTAYTAPGSSGQSISQQMAANSSSKQRATTTSSQDAASYSSPSVSNSTTFVSKTVAALRNSSLEELNQNLIHYRNILNECEEQMAKVENLLKNTAKLEENDRLTLRQSELNYRAKRDQVKSVVLTITQEIQRQVANHAKSDTSASNSHSNTSNTTSTSNKYSASDALSRSQSMQKPSTPYSMAVSHSNTSTNSSSQPSQKRTYQKRNNSATPTSRSTSPGVPKPSVPSSIPANVTEGGVQIKRAESTPYLPSYMSTPTTSSSSSIGVPSTTGGLTSSYARTNTTFATSSPTTASSTYNSKAATTYNTSGSGSKGIASTISKSATNSKPRVSTGKVGRPPLSATGANPKGRPSNASLQQLHNNSYSSSSSGAISNNNASGSGSSNYNNNSSTAPALPKYPIADKLSNKRKINELIKDLSPPDMDGATDPDVDELISDLIDEFVDNVSKFACKLAKHRKSDHVEIKDLQLHLERNWNIRIPGYLPDEVTVFQRSVPSKSYIHKLDTLALYKTFGTNPFLQKPGGPPNPQ